MIGVKPEIKSAWLGRALAQVWYGNKCLKASSTEANGAEVFGLRTALWSKNSCCLNLQMHIQSISMLN